MKNVTTFWLPIILFLGQGVLKFIPNKIGLIEKDISFYNIKITDGNILNALIFLLLLFIFIINQYFSNQKPYKKFLAFEETKIHLLDENIKGFIKDYENKGLILRVNIMIQKYKYSKFIFKKHFLKTVYNINMEYDPDKNLNLFTNQGVVGKAIKEGITFFDLTTLNNEELEKTLNLTKDQIEKTIGLKFVLSIPIYEKDIKTNQSLDKILGAVNIDSKDIKFNDIKENESYNIIVEDLINRGKNIAYLVSKLY